MTVEDTLNTRATTHGDFAQNAEVCQKLKLICTSSHITNLTYVQQEALDNICQKMARILTGNPNHADNWHDIAGYAMLAEREAAYALI